MEGCSWGRGRKVKKWELVENPANADYTHLCRTCFPANILPPSIACDPESPGIDSNDESESTDRHSSDEELMD